MPQNLNAPAVPVNMVARAVRAMALEVALHPRPPDPRRMLSDAAHEIERMQAWLARIAESPSDFGFEMVEDAKRALAGEIVGVTPTTAPPAL